MAARTVLVTGGAGHIGSHVVEMLVADPDTRVIVVDDYSNGRVGNQVPGAEYRRGHTRDVAALVAERVHLVYHLGEYARISTSFEDVRKVVEGNLLGTLAVAEFCRQRDVSKLVYAGSSTRFASEGDGRHQNPYSFSKAANVDLIAGYGRWFGLPYAICYFYNAFGPRERGDGKYATLIAKFERQSLNGEPLAVVAPGTQRRVFTYVRDLARGIILAGERGWGDGYAFGAARSYSILEIAAAFGGPVEIVEGYAGRAESTLDPTRAREELGWEPTLDVLDYIGAFVRARPKRVAAV